MPTRRLDFDAVRELALELPDVDDASGERGVAFKTHGRLLACTAIHSSADEGSLAVRFDPGLRASLLAADPDVYYVTPHYEPYPMVLVRLARIRRTALRKLLGTAWIFATAQPARARPRKAKAGGPRRRRPRGEHSGARAEYHSPLRAARMAAALWQHRGDEP